MTDEIKINKKEAMAYTKERIKQMSDHQINFAVAEKAYIVEAIEDTSFHVVKGTDHHWKWLDIFGVHPAWSSCGIPFFRPCSNWNDVMPITERFNFNIVSPASKSVSVTWKGHKLTHHNPNLKRAICEVFLMMDLV